MQLKNNYIKKNINNVRYAQVLSAKRIHLCAKIFINFKQFFCVININIK